MKLIIDKDEFWIKNDTVLPSNFDLMNNDEKWIYLLDNKLLHRKKEPAAIYFNGSQFWYLNGKLHRINGPAFINSNGHQAWYLNDKCVDGEIYKKIEESSKEELLMYMILPKYKNYISLIDYRLEIL